MDRKTISPADIYTATLWVWSSEIRYIEMQSAGVILESMELGCSRTASSGQDRICCVIFKV